MSPSLTGPLTFLMMKRFWSSMNLTLTWVTCPRDPVLPIIFTTTACLIWLSILQQKQSKVNSVPLSSNQITNVAYISNTESTIQIAKKRRKTHARKTRIGQWRNQLIVPSENPKTPKQELTYELDSNKNPIKLPKQLNFQAWNSQF